MKILAIVFAIVITGGIVANYFSDELLRIKNEVLNAVLNGNATGAEGEQTDTVAKPTSSDASPEPKWVPPGFRGPTGKPSIIGPSGNPPNY